LLPNYSKEDIAKIDKVDILAWMNESRSYLPAIYGFQNNVIDQNYVDENSKTIEKLLLLSGLRISSILETVFK
jgi:hypothetical protein